jgi:hypothetical protein
MKDIITALIDGVVEIICNPLGWIGMLIFGLVIVMIKG